MKQTFLLQNSSSSTDPKTRGVWLHKSHPIIQRFPSLILNVMDLGGCNEMSFWQTMWVDRIRVHDVPQLVLPKTTAHFNLGTKKRNKRKNERKSLQKKKHAWWAKNELGLKWLQNCVDCLDLGIELFNGSLFLPWKSQSIIFCRTSNLWFKQSLSRIVAYPSTLKMWLERIWECTQFHWCFCMIQTAGCWSSTMVCILPSFKHSNDFKKSALTQDPRGSKSNHRIRVPNFGKASKLSRYFISVFFTLESCNSKKGAHVNLFVLPVNRLENRLKVQNFMNGIHPVLPTHTIPGWSCMSGHQVQTSSAKKRHRQRGEATKTADFAKWLGLSILLKKAEWTSLRQKLQTFHTIVFQPQVEGCIVRTNELLATFPAAFFKPANPGTETKHVRIHEFAWRSSWSECRRDQDPEKLFWTNNLYIFTSENCRA